MKVRWWIAALAGVVLFAVPALAQPASAPPAYGPPITLAQAKKVMAAAETEARKSPSPVAIYIVEPSGGLVMMERMDNTQYGSVALAQKKAETAAMFKRPSQVFQDHVQANVYLLQLGAPTVIGAIGVSGSPTSSQDEVVAKAGIEALGKK